MSDQGILKFAEILESNAEVSTRFNELAASATGTRESMTELVAFGKDHGCDFTEEEIKSLCEADVSEGTDGELSDEGLEDVAGGGGFSLASQLRLNNNLQSFRSRLTADGLSNRLSSQAAAPWSGGF